VNNCVTAGNSAAPIFSPAAFTASFSDARQNWYVQPRVSSAMNMSPGKPLSTVCKRFENSGAMGKASTGSSGLNTPGRPGAA
jgi:hypothetical protein